MGRIYKDKYLGPTPEEWATARLLPSDPIFISTREVAMTLGVTDQTVRNWIEAGMCPAIRIGSERSAYRIPASWLIDICRKGLGYAETADRPA
jgi:excisionase family DNA binding protein